MQAKNEKKVLINGMNKRCDALFYNQKLHLLLENNIFVVKNLFL